MARIQVIGYEESEGELREIYEDLIQSRGKLAGIHQIQSLNPKTITHHMDLYMSIMFGKSPLKRVQREMLGVVVSRANGCAYCQIHHLEAVKHYWKDDERAEQLRNDYRKAALPAGDLALCRYADALTRAPEKAEQDSHYLQPLKNAGFSDRAILDATLVVSYFNFVNRMVLALGVDVEHNPGGYKY